MGESNGMRRGVKRQFTAVLVTVFLGLLLPGCRLAREEAEESAEPDRMIGVYVTKGSLDLFDFESYMEDHIEDIVREKDTVIENAASYEKRLYAVLQKRLLTGEDGSTSETYEYVFSDVPGYGFYAPFISGETAGGEGFRMLYNDEGFGDTSGQIRDTDLGTDLTLEATLYVAQTGSQGVESGVWVINPVWQSADGSVYLTGGQGISGSLSDGARMSHTVTNTRTVSEDGETMQLTDTFTVHIEGMALSVQIELVELDAHSDVIRRESYLPGELPQTYVPQAQTACILVATHKQDGEGETVSRELYDETDTGITTFREQDGLCVPVWTELKWEESAAWQTE